MAKAGNKPTPKRRTLIAEPGSYAITLRPVFTIRPAKSSRKRKNQGGGEQTFRARVVLKRMFGGREGYPTRDKLPPVDLYDRFAKEYERVEGKVNPPSKLGMPSREVVMREVGYKDT